MAKKSTGLGKGLDSLIPDFYDEDFDSNSAVSLEDMLSEDENGSEDYVADYRYHRREHRFLGISRGTHDIV